MFSIIRKIEIEKTEEILNRTDLKAWNRYVLEQYLISLYQKEVRTSWPHQ